MLKRLSLAFAVTLATTSCCASQAPSPAAGVIAVVQPYAAVLVLADTADHSLGRTGCDLNGQPVIWLHRGLPPERVAAVLLHERVHVEQMRAYVDGCFEFAERYRSDAAFKLRAEAEAFCVVYEAQRRVGAAADPSVARILQILMTPGPLGYGATWSEAEAKRAMACWSEPPPVR